jgi:cytidylate kinase
MFRIITIEREYGCGAAEIARQLAERLGWKLWDQRITEEIAALANVDCSEVERQGERLDNPVYRLAKVFWRGSYERALPLGDSKAFDCDCMVSTMEKIAQRIAREGNAVVVGRGAPYFLRGRDDHFCVFLYAPRAEKIRRLVASGTSEQEAEELVDTVDDERKAFIRHYFHVEWPQRALYHMMINTTIGNELVILTILDAMGRLKGKNLETSGIGEAR